MYINVRPNRTPGALLITPINVLHFLLGGRRAEAAPGAATGGAAARAECGGSGGAFPPQDALAEGKSGGDLPSLSPAWGAWMPRASYRNKGTTHLPISYANVRTRLMCLSSFSDMGKNIWESEVDPSS